ncbi:MAG: hypothetical protein ZNDK_0322 [Candidatus Desulfovibrio kirbyi]|uniref:Uncharacterized protein n=1 Tax=Candidatus Desulfovibrio kirbyi TaxID=2696086 RepID=A0A6L2R4R5_9BACT|nr:MAG: hypothetical protein ZNDK_0322 [Candidatus Desulfovibrio kirbyi]
MSKMRSAKLLFREWLLEPYWNNSVEEIVNFGTEAIAPLLSILPCGSTLKHRAASALAQTTTRLTAAQPENGRNIVRRLMWHMNEDSGNIGWGIPEAFGEILAADELLSKEYHNILFSYIINTGKSDNYCGNSALRCSCYWAVGRLAEARPQLCLRWRSRIADGLHDENIVCCGYAAWALMQLPPDSTDAPTLRSLSGVGRREVCELFDGDVVYEKTVSQLAYETLSHSSGELRIRNLWRGGVQGSFIDIEHLLTRMND